MTLLSDINGVGYTVISDTTHENAGLAGGELRAIIVERFDTPGRYEFMSVEHRARCVEL